MRVFEQSLDTHENKSLNILSLMLLEFPAYHWKLNIRYVMYNLIDSHEMLYSS